MEKNLSTSAGDIRNVGLIIESGRSPGGGHGNPLQYSCLGNPMDKGVHGVAELDTTEQLNNNSHPYMTTEKTIALTRWTFVSKVMCLLFNTLNLS